VRAEDAGEGSDVAVAGEDRTEEDRGEEGRVGLGTIAREWGRIGCIGFGGPPTHIALLRQLCVDRRRWIAAAEFEDGIAATNLLPGPASTQLAIFTAWRLRGLAGALVGGVCFIVPGLVLILALAALFLAGHPPLWVRGAAAGAGAAVAAVAVQAAVSVVPASWKRAGQAQAARARWIGYCLAGGAAAALTGPWLVLVLIGAGLVEVAVRARPSGHPDRRAVSWPLLATAPAAGGGLLALAWVALKVGALSYGGGFVIIPLMQADAVDRYHWMTDGQFLNAVALGQITPGRHDRDHDELGEDHDQRAQDDTCAAALGGLLRTGGAAVEGLLGVEGPGEQQGVGAQPDRQDEGGCRIGDGGQEERAGQAGDAERVGEVAGG